MEPDNIEYAPKIPETLSIHKVTRSFNEDNIFLLISFVWLMTVISQFYRTDDDPEVCGHENLPLLFDVDQTCAFCKAKYVALKDKKIGCNVSCVNNGFTRVAFRNNSLL